MVQYKKSIPNDKVFFYLDRESRKDISRTYKIYLGSRYLYHIAFVNGCLKFELLYLFDYIFEAEMKTISAITPAFPSYRCGYETQNRSMSS